MSANNSTTWFWSDWFGDQEVRRLTVAERGLWIDLLGLAASGTPIGYVTDREGLPVPTKDIARLANIDTAAEVDALIGGIVAKGVASVDTDGRLYNRRMVRVSATSANGSAKKLLLTAKRREAGKLGALLTNAKRWGTSAKANELTSKSDLGDSKTSANAESAKVGKLSPLGARLTIPLKESSFGTESERLAPSEALLETETKKPGGSLAPALPTGALRSPPDAVPEGEAEGQPASKLPHEMTAAEVLEARQKAKGKPT